VLNILGPTTVPTYLLRRCKRISWSTVTKADKCSEVTTVEVQTARARWRFRWNVLDRIRIAEEEKDRRMSGTEAVDGWRAVPATLRVARQRKRPAC